jgi:hypothetical protein
VPTTLATAQYCGAATTNSLLSPKISDASSRIGRSSGKIGQLAIAFPRECEALRSDSSSESLARRDWRNRLDKWLNDSSESFNLQCLDDTIAEQFHIELFRLSVCPTLAEAQNELNEVAKDALQNALAM